MVYNMQNIEEIKNSVSLILNKLQKTFHTLIFVNYSNS